MQPQRSLFGIFLFIIVQMAASPAFIMWTTPLYAMDFLCEQREVGLDHRKRLGPIWSYRQCCCLPVGLICDQQRTPFHHGWFPLPAVLSEACHIEANMGLDLHLSHSQQTINDMNSNSHNRKWINLINTPTVFRCSPLYFKQWKLDTHIITPAKKHAANGPLTRPHNPKSHQCYSLCWASWKRFLKKKNLWWILCCD